MSCVSDVIFVAGCRSSRQLFCNFIVTMYVCYVTYEGRQHSCSNYNTHLLYCFAECIRRLALDLQVGYSSAELKVTDGAVASLF